MGREGEVGIVDNGCAPSPKIIATDLNNCFMARKDDTTPFLGRVAWDSGPVGYRAAVFMKAVDGMARTLLQGSLW